MAKVKKYYVFDVALPWDWMSILVNGKEGKMQSAPMESCGFFPVFHTEAAVKKALKELDLPITAYTVRLRDMSVDKS